MEYLENEEQEFRVPHTLPFRRNRLRREYEHEEDKKALQTVQKHFKLTSEMVKEILESSDDSGTEENKSYEEEPTDETLHVETETDTGTETEHDDEKTSDEDVTTKIWIHKTTSQRKPGRLSELDEAENDGEMDEAKEKSVRFEKSRLCNSSESESENEIDSPVYDTVARGLELKEGELENERHLQGLTNKTVFMEFQLNELKKAVDKDIKNLFKVIRKFEDIDGFQEDIAAVLEEEDISSISIESEEEEEEESDIASEEHSSHSIDN